MSEEKSKIDFQNNDQVGVHHSELMVSADLMTDAVDGENREHEMGMLAAIKQYPWACLWAFIMCFTIVSPFLTMRLWIHRPILASAIAYIRRFCLC